MSENLIMNFPILKPNCADFTEGVGYAITASQDNKILTITHTLTGQSFVRELVQSGKAKFSVRLLYRDSSDRQHEACEYKKVTEGDEIVVGQSIPIKFSYAPEVIPSIVILEGSSINFTNQSCGLDEFWRDAGNITIPKYARIALAPKLKFTSGGLSSLFKIDLDETFADGKMSVEVKKCAGEGEIPVTLLCGQHVYDQLKLLRKIPEITSHTQPKSNSPIESLRYALVTNALCALYAHMHQFHKPDDGYENNGVLLAHLELLQEKTGKSWKDDEFYPSLVATEMLPYMLDAKTWNGDPEDD